MGIGMHPPRRRIDYVWSPTWESSVRVLGLVEAGSVQSINPQSGQSAQAALCDAGLGLRLQFAKDASISLDAAQALNGSSATKAQDWRANLALVMKF
jgi:hemolysin activation/secretion protein